MAGAGGEVYDVGKGLWTTKGEDHEVAVKNFIATYKQLEETLGDKPYFGGDTFGFVDIALIPFYSWVYTYDTFGNIKMEQEFPKYVEWGKRCMQKESVSKSLADQKQVYDFAIFLRKKFGLE
ncbi:putative glutathione S-transferase [Senna tora]|uniref:Glutathione S-transferase n=1 Tax=Senna tora TaxID=362788 RepID=A0A834WH46_9FABA|nr:putative glutathione S-transferase [Senna tora]